MHLTISALQISASFSNFRQSQFIYVITTSPDTLYFSCCMNRTLYNHNIPPNVLHFTIGGRDGTVKIWNFNNGNCLRTLTPVDDEEITGIVCTKQRIITVGWSKKVAIYKDSRSDEVSLGFLEDV